MKELKTLAIVACAILCGALIIGCNDDTGNKPIRDVSADWYDGWLWEVVDDKNPNKFAPGISTLNGYTEHPTKYSQTFLLKDPYIRGEPLTGWYKIGTINVKGQEMEIAMMEDAKGFDPRGSLMPTDPDFDMQYAWPNNKGKGALIPLKVPTKVKTTGPSGKEIDALRFWGTTLQKGSEAENSDDWVMRTGVTGNTSPITTVTDYRLSAGWPAISWYATPLDAAEDPNQKRRIEFADGYGYTFWVKSEKDFTVYRTSVENWDYRPNEGHEPAHWFGQRPGRDGTPDVNYTFMGVGEWKQIRVIYDPYHPEFNMDVPNWTMSYSIEQNYPGDKEPYMIKMNHDKGHSIRIIFGILLQHNGGNEASGPIEYSVDSGKHEYDVYFYGLEMLQY